jgi:hypothetical protein
MEKRKYYYVEWPESQYFMDNPDCIQSDGMSYFVPCDVYDGFKIK